MKARERLSTMGRFPLEDQSGDSCSRSLPDPNAFLRFRAPSGREPSTVFVTRPVPLAVFTGKQDTQKNTLT